MNEYKFQDLFLGQKENFTIKLEEFMMSDFKKLSGDTNALHAETSYAQSQNFKDRVVYGMLTSSFYSQLVGVKLPGKFALLQGIEIKFFSPAFVGDLLNISGEITYKNDVYKIVEIKAKILNQDGKKISTAKINVGVLN